jgi:hypothetical protein
MRLIQNTPRLAAESAGQKTRGEFVNIFSLFDRYKSAWLFAGAYLILLSVSLWVTMQALRTEVQSTSEAANTTFTRALVNANWDELRPMLSSAEDAGAAKANPKLPAIDGLIRSFSKGTELVKVKIYDLKGLTLYSSDPAQIGEDRSKNAGFIQARKGRVMSELTYRGKFGGFDGDLYNRNLVSSYVPVYGLQGVEAVVEVYTDRTDAIEGVKRQGVGLALSLAGLFGVVLGLLYALLASRQATALQSAMGNGTKSSANTPEDGSGAVYKEVTGQLTESLLERAKALRALESRCLATAPDGSQTSLVRALADLSAADDTQARRLSWLLELLDGRYRPVAEAFDLNAMLSQLFQRHAKGVRERGLEVQSHIAKELAMSFMGDPELTSRLLDLLLQVLCGRATSGVLQFKAQAGPRGLQLDLISSGTQGPLIEPLERCLVERLAQQVGGELHIQTSQDRGDWFTLALPLGKADDS